MKIGTVEIKGNVFLAPMAGITDLPFRRICKKYGASLVYSEMISAKGLHYNDKKTAELMRISPDERPTAIQIFGSDPEIMAEIVPKVIKIAAPEIIDINMGCPAPKIVNNNDGSALLKDLALAGRIMRRVSSASPIPVTAKIRSGWKEINAVEAAKILEENGAAAIAVHGRVREQFYTGKADWDIIKSVKSAVKIPVIGNGDIWEAKDAKSMLEYTGCDAVMIGRGAQGNPFIFKQINELLNDGYVSYNPSQQERIKQAAEHTAALIKEHGEYRGVREARKHIAWYIKGMPGAARLKTEIFKITDGETMLKMLNDFAVL